ncbi:MAG: phytanoyl-CoA dioxygenase family protein [Candidatus Latescibacterota bacterium]|nr:phytanoyl-CoA dioxygenase family protein [Candidatus Latescibacterota bacterium]
MKYSGLTDAQKVQYFHEGWVMVSDIFTDVDLQPVRDEITAVIHGAAQRLIAEDKLSRSYEEEPFETRLTRIFAETEEILPPIVGRAGGGHSGPAFFEFITHPALLAKMESLVGREIVGSSVYRIRPKIPGYSRGAVPWHQDSGYFSPHCDDDLIVTCWIPLVDTNAENGCLRVLPRAHRQGVLTHHTQGPGGYLWITEEDRPTRIEPITVPVPARGALLMTNLTPHMSTQHSVDIVRWAIDVRYQSATVPNNVGELPADFDSNRPDEEIACYAPEADFVVQSEEHPESVVSGWGKFNELRQRFETDRPTGPQRGWVPAETQEA